MLQEKTKTLEGQLQQAKKKEERLRLLNEYAWVMNRNNPEKAMKLSEEAKGIAEELKDTEGTGKALCTISACQIWLSKNSESLSTSFKALEYSRRANDLKTQAQINYNLGTNFFYMADYNNALKYFMQCYKINEARNDRVGQADAYNGMGTVYYSMKSNKKALHYLKEGLKICEETGEKYIKQKILDGLGTTYSNLGEYDKSIQSLRECLHLVKNHDGSKQVEAFALNSMGYSFLKLGEHDKALEIFEESLGIRREIDFKVGICTTLINIGKVYLDRRESDKAIEKLTEAYELAHKINSHEWIYKSAQLIAKIHEEKGNIKQAYQFYKTFHKAKERLKSEEQEKKNKSLELQFQMEQVEKEKKLLHQKNEELQKYYTDIKTISDIGQEITATLDFEKLLNTIYEKVNSMMDASAFFIGIINPKENVIDVRFGMENGKRIPEYKYDLKAMNKLAVWSVKKRKEVIINDYQKEAEKYIEKVKSPLVGESPESLIYQPLFIKEKVVGIISVQSFHTNAYTNYHLNMLQTLSVYAAIALENANLYENLEEKVKERTTEVVQQKEEVEKAYNNTRLLSEIGQQITSTLDFDQIFRKLHHNVNQLMDAACFGVRIYKPEEHTIVYKFEMERGEQQPAMEVSMDDDDNFSVWCVKNKKEIFIRDNEKDYKKYTNKIVVVSGDMPHSLIFYPMMIGDRVIGVITVQSFEKNAYTEYHLNILKSLASYTAIALENANLYESLEDKVRARTKEVVSQKEIIEEKNKNITESILYAKRIQEAFLPSKKLLQDHIDESFVYYQPKDIVSGDFYWVKKMGDDLIFAVVDCTGHGVPGAFMSIVGHNHLNQAISSWGLRKPSKILDYLNKQILQTFSMEDDSSIADGMDAAVCRLNLTEMTVEYAGALCPLWLVRNGELMETRADRRSVGFGHHDYTKKFKNHVFELKKNDAIYIFSDGYADQFGGKQGKKFKYSQLKDLLTSIHNKTMNEQKKILDERMEEWKGDLEQVDDICMIGVKV